MRLLVRLMVQRCCTRMLLVLRSSAISLLVRCLTLMVLTVGLRSTLHAQVDPRGDMRTIRTEHFRVHFAREHEALARRSAAYAELAWDQLARELAEPALPVELLVADNLDVSNGFATPFPTNRIVVYALPPLSTPELRHYDDWLQLVITHELVHIFHLDRARGIWSLGRKIFGRNPALIPNAYLPSWMIEGLAVHYETKLTGSGRLASTEFPMLARTAALASDVPPPGEWSLTTARFPLGQHAYGYGSLLMSAMSARAGANGDSTGGMRAFIDGVAFHPIPWRINRSAKRAFGVSIGETFNVIRDSLHANANVVREWAMVDRAARRVAPDMEWFAEQPRWESDSTLLLAMNNGRDVSGVYRAQLRASDIALTRITRRNSLDANTPLSDRSTVYAQLDFNDPYELRSDLWRRDANNNESRVVGSERVFLPDARASDGGVVAVRAVAGSAELVRVMQDGSIRAITNPHTDTAYTEPRWSPSGQAIAAVRVIRGGTQQVVLLDTSGVVTAVLHDQRGVATVPAFTPDGASVVYASDVQGSMQLYIVPVGASLMESTDVIATPPGSPGTASVLNPQARALTRVPTGITSPAISPNGQLIAALEYTLSGSRLVVVPMHRGYATSTPMPGARTYASTSRSIAIVSDSSASQRYNPLRQLVPRWWMPLVGEGSDGAATYGLSSSSQDILRRHSWAAQGTYHPTREEFEGAAGYRYTRFPRVAGWQPLFDLSGSQSWDRFRLVDTSNALLGELQRVSRFATASFTFARPRVRNSASLTLGAQLERRLFATSPESLLPSLAERFTRGVNAPAAFATATFSNVMRAGRAISLEDGVTGSLTVQQRWRSGALEQTSRRATAVARAFKAFDIGGFSRHAIGARVSGGITDQHATSELSLGGTSGSIAELVPGVQVGDPSRQFPVRGFEPGVQRGTQVVSASAEYRAPLALVARGLGLLPLFVDRLSMNVFADAGRTWCSAAVRETPSAAGLCLPPSVRQGWLASTGAELALDLGVQWDIPYRVRAGVAQPVLRPGDVSRQTSFYFTLGSSF